MAKLSSFFKVVSPKPNTVVQADNQQMGDQSVYGNFSWYQRMLAGSGSRIARYREYDFMDADVDVSRALDTIAKEITGNVTKGDKCINLNLEAADKGQTISPTVASTLQAALQYWINIHAWERRLFSIARVMCKYGDCFFIKRNAHAKWEYIHPRNVVAAMVDEMDVTKVIAWQIRRDSKRPGSNSVYQTVDPASESTSELIPAEHVIRFTLNDDVSDTAPFGESVLRAAYRTFKQKEMLEDAVLIYRIQRAPERRVFYVDVGKMPPPRVRVYLEQFKNELRQKRIPSFTGGKNEVDSVYNPQTQSEDFFFPVRPDGRGTKVETLPGGQGLGELSELDYFMDKLFRGLKIPLSYMKTGEGAGMFNDGQVGVAYMQELQFSLYIQFLQTHIETVLDQEFKLFLRQTNIHVDETSFRLQLPEPTNFGTYRRQQADQALLNNFSTASGQNSLSVRFAQKKYLQLTEEEILENERLKREELGLNPEGGAADYPLLYGGEGGGPGDIGGDLGGGGGDFSMDATDEDLGDLGDDAGDETADLDATPPEPA